MGRSGLAAGGGGNDPTTRDTSMVLRRPGFVPLLVSIFLVDLATTMTTVALPLLLVQEHGATLAVGFTVALRLLPGIVAGPVAGHVLAGRSPNRVALVSTLVVAVLSGLLALGHALWQIQVLSLAIGVASMFAKPARLVLRPAVIGAGDEMRGNSLVVAAQRVATLGAPPVVGVLLVTGDLRLVFGIAAAVFVASSVPVLRIPAVPAAEPDDTTGSPRAGSQWRRVRTSYARNARALVRAASHDSFVRGLTVTALTYALAVALGRMLLLVLGEERFADVPAFYGWMLAATGAGGIAGSLVAGRLGRVHPGTLHVVTLLGEAAIWLSLLWVDVLGVSLALMVVVGVLESAGYVVYYAQVQDRVPPKVMGYYFAAIVPLTDAFVLVGTATGAALAGWSVTASGLVVASCVAVPVLLTLRWYYPPDLRGPGRAAAAAGPAA